MKRGEKTRLLKLFSALGACLLLMGVLRPWKGRGDELPVVDPSADVESSAFESGGPVPSNDDGGDGEARVDANGSATVDDVARAATAKGRPIDAFLKTIKREARPALERDPFFFAVELSGGATLDALRRREAEARALAEAAAARAADPTEGASTTPAAPPTPKVAEEVVAEFRDLKLLGVVRGADGGAVVLSGKGRVRVGEVVRDTPFVLREIKGLVAVFAAEDVVVELAIPKRRASRDALEDR
jgi:hypothetical protein